MKRPFVWLGVLFTVLVAVWHMTGSSQEGSPPEFAERLLLEEAAGKTITVSGIVAQCGAVSEGLRLSVNHITICKNKNSEQSLPSNLKLSMTIEDGALAPGDRIEVSGKPAAFEASSNPGAFDLRAYYFTQNIVCTLKNPVVRNVQRGGLSLPRLLFHIRSALGDSYERILEEKAARTIAAISLGEKGLLEEEWKDRYQEGGIAHILAVSGLHITLIGMGIYRLVRRGGLPFPVCAVLSGAAVLLYAAMTGFGISAARAAVMFLIWLGAQVWGRKYDMLTAAAAAAMLLLTVDAGNLQQSSFWLSFGAIVSIAALVPQLVKTCGIKTRPGNALISGASLWLGTLPVTLFFFYQTSPWSILVNLAVIPLMSVIMTSGLLAAAAGLVFAPAGMFLAAPVYYLLGCFEWLCRLEQRLPAAVWVTGQPSVGQLVLYYGLLSAAAVLTGQITAGKRRGGRKRRGRRSTVARFIWLVCGVFCVCLVGIWHPARQGLEIICLDVGQGDGAIVRLPSGENCLIDGGSTSKGKLWRYTIGQSVKYYGIRTLDYIFLSHADRDHISGITEYLQEYEPGFGGRNVHGVTLRYLILPPTADPSDFAKLRELAAEKGIALLRMKAGDVIAATQAEEQDGQGDADASGRAGRTTGVSEHRFGEDSRAEEAWSIRCLGPDALALSGDRNEDSMVLMLRYGTFRMLFTGDLEGAAERKLAQSGTALEADVLKVGHHGSAGGSTEEFLEQVRPKAAVISCGRDNAYGHPAGETLGRLEHVGSRIFDTKEQGAIRICSDGRTFSVETYGNPG